MKQYETPAMLVIAFEAKEAVAFEIDLDFGTMISENSMPKA